MGHQNRRVNTQLALTPVLLMLLSVRKISLEENTLGKNMREVKKKRFVFLSGILCIMTDSKIRMQFILKFSYTSLL